jgi:uncharacterized membrane protein
MSSDTTASAPAAVAASALTASVPRRVYLLAALLLGSGTLHFLAPRLYDTVVPRALPGAARGYTYLSGAAELGVGAALIVPATRRLGGLLAALLFAAIFPANIQFTADSLRNPKASKAVRIGSVLRLPFQIPLITESLKINRAQQPG